jgi:hypothetical protein
MLDEWIPFHSSYVVGGKFSVPPGTKFPIRAHTKGTLWIRFDSGFVCHYENVSWTIWEGLLNADSKGKFHHQAIRHLPYKAGE